MLTDAMLSFWATLVNSLTAPLPDWIPFDWSTLTGDVAPITHYLAWSNLYLPVDALLSCFEITIGYLLVLYPIKGVLWFLNQIHVTGGGTSGD